MLTNIAYSLPIIAMALSVGLATSPQAFATLGHELENAVAITDEVNTALRESLSPLALPCAAQTAPSSRKRKNKELNLSNEGNVKKAIEALDSKIWVDLSEAEDYGLFPEYKPLKDAIEVYHKVNKTEKSLVSLRQRLLLKINELCQFYLAQSSRYKMDGLDRLKIELISQTALNKRDYLAELGAIRGEAEKMIFRMQKPGRLMTALKSAYIKVEGLEHLDPAMRDKLVLRDYFINWEEAVSKNPKTPDFFYWLEGQDVPKSVAGSDAESWSGTVTRVVKYDSDKKRLVSTPVFTRPEKTYGGLQVEVKGKNAGAHEPIEYTGSFKIEPGKPSEEIYYVVDESGNLMIRADSPFHSHIIRGKNVLSAGFVTFKDGKIIRIDNSSGHYAPSGKHLNGAVKLLREKLGPDAFAPNFVVENWGY